MEIAVVGTGNVAFHLVKAFFSAGHRIVGVFARNSEKATQLAKMVETEAYDLGSPMPACDVCVMAVSDNAIPAVAAQLRIAPSTLLVHTSGATDVSALSCARRHGVLYPCQTFSAADNVDIGHTPFLVEASDESGLATLKALAQTVSEEKPLEANSQCRAMLHVAAVFASNFCNHNLLIAQRLLAEANLPMDVLKVLVGQTIDKAFRLGPLEAQTGPARRHDTTTISRHECMLNNHVYRRIYEVMTESIGKTYCE